MANKIRSLLFVALFSHLTISCQMISNHHVEFIEINQEGIATFKVFNNTSEDIFSINFELTYLNADEKVIKVDTVHYSMSETASSRVFLEAGEQTIISQKVPGSTNTASAKIISTSN